MENDDVNNVNQFLRSDEANRFEPNYLDSLLPVQFPKERS